MDLLIKNGKVIDGSGNPWYRADILIDKGKVLAVKRNITTTADRVIDVEGLYISPGWVDIHSHSDWSLLFYPKANSLLIQGCTLTVTGNCGMSAAPIEGSALERGIQRGKKYSDNFKVDWSTFDQYLNKLMKQGTSMNVASLIGHSSLRQGVMGDAERNASSFELQKMGDRIKESMEAGAFGLSTGLVYWPGCWSSTEELIYLSKIIAKYNGIYVSHIRGERETSIDATKEVIRIGREANIPVHISHFQCKYPAYGRTRERLKLIHQARAEGIDIACDSDAFPWIYYEANSILPPWPFKDNPEEFTAMLKDKEKRKQLRGKMKQVDPTGPLGRTGDGGIYQQRAWDRVWVYNCPSDPIIEGKKISDIAKERNIEPEDVLFDLIISENGRGPGVFVAHIEDDHHLTVPDPLCIFPSTDCAAVDLSLISDDKYLQYSPEWLSLFPRVISRYVKEEGLMTLEEAIRKMTSFPCQRLGIRDRGLLREGMWADITIFDYNNIMGKGTYENPLEYPSGIKYVLVNGKIVVEDGIYNGIVNGQVLKHGF
jgi:N-acyl-D-amino-acid deacylase